MSDLGPLKISKGLQLDKHWQSNLAPPMGRIAIPSRQEIAAPFASKEAFIDFLRAPKCSDGRVTIGDARWSNVDLEPTPEKDRTWTW